MPWTQGEFKVPHNFVTEYNAGQKKIRADLVDENFTDISGAVNKVVADYKAADTALETSVNQKLDQTVADLTAIAEASFLAGGIVMFSGTFGGASGRNPIPRGATEADTNWVLCDGGSDGKGGTVPDLRDKFIIGAGPAHTSGTTGGAESHTHTLNGGSIGATTLNTNQMPSHNHTMGVGNDSGNRPYIDGCNGVNNWETATCGYAGGSQSHTHSLTLNGTATGSNIPPYYALSFIMKVS